MNDIELITINTIVSLLRYEGTKNPERNAREWLYRHKIKGFRRGFYVKEIIETEMKKDIEKCYRFGKEASTFMLGELLVGGKTQPISKRVQELLQKKKLLNMRTL